MSEVQIPMEPQGSTAKRVPKLQTKTVKYKNALINVTSKEIETSIPEDSRHCMIADAVKHCLPDVRSVSVDLATIRFTKTESGERFTYATPYPAQQALVSFDNGTKPEPFSFRLKTLYQIRPKSNIARKTPSTILHDHERTLTNPNADKRDRAPVQIGGRAKPKAPLGYIRRFGLRVLPSAFPASKTTYEPKT